VADDPRPRLVEQAFADYRARNMAGLVAFLHPEIESHVSASLANSGTFQGVAGFVAMNAGWEEAFQNVRYEIRDIDLLDDRNALVEVHQEAEGAGSGVPVELDVVFLIEFEGEQAIRFRIHANREEALAAV
jgi:ketosteroid isomerase-like protein